MSIYLPMERAGREVRQNRIRVKNALDSAEERLSVHGMRRPEAEEMVAGVRELLDDETFWQQQEDGLAIFADRAHTETYRTDVRFAPRVIVADVFHVKQLMEAVADGRFSLLALSRNRVRLFSGDRASLTELTFPDDVPTSFEEATRFVDEESQLQHRSMDRTGQGTIAAGFHGHGVPDENDEERLRTFLRAVDAATIALIGRQRPVVPAGVDELVAQYRSVSEQPRLTTEGVSGSPDNLSTDQLHEAAWGIAEPVLMSQRRDDRDRIEAGRGLHGVESTVPAAIMGRVSAVFVARGDAVWGRVLTDRGDVDVHDEPVAGDHDLLDVAAQQAWATGARVHVVPGDDVPGDRFIAAALRY